MKSVELPYGRIEILEKDLAEVIFDDGIELNEQMVDNFHLALATHLKAPYRVLFNKRNNYSYNFAAQRKVGGMPQLRSIAVVVYNRAAEMSARVIAKVSQHNGSINIFSCREMALTWLDGQNKNNRATVH